MKTGDFHPKGESWHVSTTFYGWYLLDRFREILWHGGAEKNVLCSDWEREYVQGQSWTVIVGSNQLSKLGHNTNW